MKFDLQRFVDGWNWKYNFICYPDNGYGGYYAYYYIGGDGNDKSWIFTKNKLRWGGALINIPYGFISYVID